MAELDANGAPTPRKCPGKQLFWPGQKWWKLRDIRKPPTSQSDRAVRMLVAGGGAGVRTLRRFGSVWRGSWCCQVFSSLLFPSVLSFPFFSFPSFPFRAGAPLCCLSVRCPVVVQAIAKTIVAPLERVKLLCQIEGMQMPPGQPRTGVFEMFAVIARTNGARGFWTGNLANVRYLLSRTLHGR